MTVMTAIRSAETEAAREAEKRIARSSRAAAQRRASRRLLRCALCQRGARTMCCGRAPTSSPSLPWRCMLKPASAHSGEIHVAALELGHESGAGRGQ